MRNLLAPLTFSFVEVRRFVAFRCCALCYGALVATPAPDGMFYARCQEHGEMRQHSHISKRKAAEYRAGQLAAQMDLGAEAHRGKSEAQLLAELGF